jgi:hypothetical protein
MWINQTIRNCHAKTQVKYFRTMWLEVNNQGYEVLKSGDLYTLSFSLYRGRKGRIPLRIHSASHNEVLDQLIANEAKLGSLKLCKSKAMADVEGGVNDSPLMCELSSRGINPPD